MKNIQERKTPTPDTTMATSPPPSSSILSQKTSRLPDDTVFYAIFPDFSLNPTAAATSLSSSLNSLHLKILQTISPFVSDYIWQHEPFTLSASPHPSSTCLCSDHHSHLHGKLRYGDNLDDEWFTVFLLFEISRRFPDLSIRVWDTDGEFLLIEAAFHLPRWLNPDNSLNRVFVRRGDLHIVPKDRLPSPTLDDSLKFINHSGDVSRAPEPVQTAVKNRISEYPDRARLNTHKVRVLVPVSVAQVLKHEPCLISLAVEAFYDRDIDSMKYAAKMEKFLSKGKEEELVRVSVKMSRAMYAQLVQQTFQAPKCYPMPSRSETSAYLEAELGMKIACGFEMMYQQRLREGSEGKGSTWEAFKESLEKSGYFEGHLPGSQEYRRLMHNAEQQFKNSYLSSNVSEMIKAPLKRIDEILALPHSENDFKGHGVSPSDDDTWLYNGEDELNSALSERQKELELYNAKHKDKKKSKVQQDDSESRSTNVDEFDPSDIAKTMKAFVSKVSSYKGAEVPEDRNLKEVNLDVDRFIKDMESVMKQQGFEDIASDDDIEEGSSSDLDFEESEDESDEAEPSEGNEDGGDTFMQSYSDVLNEELKSSTLEKSFVRAKEQVAKKDEGTSNTSTADMEEDFTPVDADVNLVKSFLDSFSSQEGLPGPASNLLGLMGLQLKDANKKGK
ncbi:protein ecdysoneless homolog isoform X1 [Cannabis sativa]|uniref:protein ecdysoneless homolog isoform X1 n=1 Tax=Cannabis sativa TaxID=3483 RepID=UPI0029CAAAE8|nr:protein ecdysoneless homolog isoform X1 [Cannabis sativa]